MAGQITGREAVLAALHIRGCHRDGVGRPRKGHG